MITSSHSRLVRDLPRCQCLSVHCAVSHPSPVRPKGVRSTAHIHATLVTRGRPPLLNATQAPLHRSPSSWMMGDRARRSDACIHGATTGWMPKPNPIQSATCLPSLPLLVATSDDPLTAFLEAPLPILLNVCFKNPDLSNP